VPFAPEADGVVAIDLVGLAEKPRTGPAARPPRAEGTATGAIVLVVAVAFLVLGVFLGQWAG
jgi:hypothetical protein